MTPHRRTSSAGLTLAVALTAGSAAAANLTPLQALRTLAGVWAGDGTTLNIDVARLQGNVDPDRPFEWRALRIVDVSGRMVIFDIGDRRFVAMLDPARTLRVTSTSFTGERSLHLVRR